MTLKLRCGACGKGMRVSSRHEGKCVACPGCRHPVNVPELLEADETPPPREPPLGQGDLWVTIFSAVLAGVLAAMLLAWLLLHVAGGLPVGLPQPASRWL